MDAGRVITKIRNGTIGSTMSSHLLRPYYLSERNVFSKQEWLLRRVLKEASRHCLYYKLLFDNQLCLDINKYPIVDKKIITENFNQFCNERVQRYDCYDAYTGGSTGEPFHFLKSGGFETDFGRRKWNLYGYVDGETILAMDGTKLSHEELINGNYVKQVSNNDIPFGSLAMSSLYLTDDNALEYCQKILELKPSFLRGYPSFIYSLASYSENFGLNMKGFVKAVELTSESPLSYQIEKIKKVFDCKVYLQYGHTEASIFAYTVDDSYVYRVEPLYGYVEILDEKNEPVGINQVGEVVVTSLCNLAMPLIRYRTGDYAEYGGKDNRFIYLNKVLGRTQDYIVNRNGDKVLLTALIFGQHFHAMGHISKWQIEQFDPGVITIHIVKGEGYSDVDEKELRDLFRDLGGVTTEFLYEDSIELTSRGKSKMLIQHIQYVM